MDTQAWMVIVADADDSGKAFAWPLELMNAEFDLVQNETETVTLMRRSKRPQNFLLNTCRRIWWVRTGNKYISKFTSPLKLFDYLSVGRAIICSNFKVLKEVIKPNKNAIFIKNYKNVFSWIHEINKISYSNQKQFIMSKNNYKLGKKYSLKNRAKKIIESIKN